MSSPDSGELFYYRSEVKKMDEWMRLVQEVGFPIFVSFYLMHRVETKLVAIHDALITLKA
jgi:hypothetical protein